MLLLYVALGIERFITHCYTFYYLFIIIVLDKIIMLIGTWSDHLGKPQGFMNALG